VPTTSDLYLSYAGIRVTDLQGSIGFYTGLFGLEEIARGDNSAIGGGIYVLLRDRNSGQKLELNYYPKDSPYATLYVAGEGLDHISFRVDSVAETLAQLAKKGIRKVDLIPSLQSIQGDLYNFHVAYVKDPDGNWIEIYDHSDNVDYSKISKGY
jgi:catechol 2,3-dioxygenase-like lactoylglutathione lyase family enzyme